MYGVFKVEGIDGENDDSRDNHLINLTKQILNENGDFESIDPISKDNTNTHDSDNLPIQIDTNITTTFVPNIENKAN